MKTPSNAPSPPVRRLRAAAAIASTTATELFGQPIVLLLTLGGVLATALVPLLQLHTFGEPGRLPRDGGLAYQLVIGLVLAVTSASTSLHDEIENGTAAVAIGKPVSRNLFLVGKWLGVLLVVARFWFCLLATTMLAERVPERLVSGTMASYLTDKAARAAIFLMPTLSLAVAGLLHNRFRLRFCKTATALLSALLGISLAGSFLFTRDFTFAPSAANTNLRIVPVSLLVLAALAVYAAIATALATRLRAAPALVVCLLLLLLGLSADALLGPSSPAAIRLAAHLIPNLQSFWMCDALANGGSIPYPYVLRALLYAAALCSLALGCGMLAFRKRDL